VAGRLPAQELLHAVDRSLRHRSEGGVFSAQDAHQIPGGIDQQSFLAGEIRRRPCAGQERAKPAKDPHRLPAPPLGELLPEGLAEITNLARGGDGLLDGGAFVEIGGTQEAGVSGIG
jgi:hypothetical protein